jgi:hypothetical protein
LGKWTLTIWCGAASVIHGNLSSSLSSIIVPFRGKFKGAIGPTDITPLEVDIQINT